MPNFFKLKSFFNFLLVAFFIFSSSLLTPYSVLAAPIKNHIRSRPGNIKTIQNTVQGQHKNQNKSKLNKRLPLIYLDPGHGALDFGAVIKRPHLEEKRLCLLTAHYTKQYLEKMGYRVSLTRSRDVYVTLDKRAYLANRFKAGLYISIHYNSCPNPAIAGIEVYYHDKPGKKKTVSSRRLASKVLQQMLVKTKARSRGVKRGNFLVIRDTKMPAILIEAGFLTNIKERNRIKQRQYLFTIAKGIANGINSFVKS